MFSRIVIVLNDLPESQRALRTAIELARAFNAELATVSILEDPPAYTSFAMVVDPNALNAKRKTVAEPTVNYMSKRHYWPGSMEFARKVRS
jgi:nucleotide-binding universal stress UspA family protein